jgi:hypothetical protein
MTANYPDPFEDTSPWEQSSPTPTPDHTTTEAALTAPAPHTLPFKIGFTLKAGTGFDAEWLTPTVYGNTAEETAQRGAELLTAMKTAGLIDLTAKAADYTRGQYRGTSSATPKRFEDGKVRRAEAPADNGDTCPHGRKLVEKENWAARFCQAQDRADQCAPLWRQKDGTFKAK